MLKQKVCRSASVSRVGIIGLSLMVLLSLSLWPGLFVRPLQAQSVRENPVLGDETYFTCTPIGVASFNNRVHVRCSAAAPGGIYWFAVSTTDSGRASRFLSIFTTAKVTGKNLGIWYNSTDLSGGAWGCNNSDCRNISGAEVLQ